MSQSMARIAHEAVRIAATTLLSKTSEVTVEEARDRLKLILKRDVAGEAVAAPVPPPPALKLDPVRIELEVKPVEIRIQPLATGCAIGTVGGVVGGWLVIQGVKAVFGAWGDRRRGGRQGRDV